MIRHAAFSLLLAVTAVSALQVSAQAPSMAKPEDVGFSSERLAYMDKFYSAKIDKGELAGMVILVSRHGKIVHESALGYADLEKHKKMDKNSIFRYYSMTKPIASTALMMLYEEGRFQIDDPIAKYLPEFANIKVLRTPDAAFTDTVPAEHAPTIHDVLRHTAGFTHGISGDTFDNELYDKNGIMNVDITLKEMMARLAKQPLRYQPGTKFNYSVGPDVVARLVEVLSGMPFDEFLAKRMFGPLNMRDTGFWVSGERADRLVPVNWWKDGKLVPLDAAHGHPGGDINPIFQPWSVNSYTENHPRKGGSYGLVGTAEDYWRFTQMMLNGGELNGKRLLSPRTVEFMIQDHLVPAGIPDFDKGKGFGLGFAVIRNSAAAGILAPEGTAFWGGAASTYFWIDPKEDVTAVIMTQHMATPATDALGTQLPAFIYGALTGK